MTSSAKWLLLFAATSSMAATPDEQIAAMERSVSALVTIRRETPRVACPALLSDARAIADVHVRSWQSAYHGVVPDAYLEALSVDKREMAFRDADATPTVGEIEAIYVSPSRWSTG